VHVTVAELAALVQGEVHGNGGLAVCSARPLHEAGPSDVSFLEHERNLRHFKGCRARALVVPVAVAGRRAEMAAPGAEPPTLIAVRDSLLAFCAIVQRLHGRPEPAPGGIDPRAAVHPTATVGADPTIHPLASVGEGTVIGARCRIHPAVVVGRFCRLGDDVTLYPNAVLYDGTVVGNRVIVHANAVLGADGFGYRLQDGRHVKVPQLGCVELGDDVEVGACTTIDRGTFQPTRVGQGTKIDNLVQVAHNCQIGRHNMFVGQVGVAGSSSTGDYVVLAGQAGIADHIHLHDRVVVGAQSGVFRDVAAGERVLGVPAKPERDEKRIMLSLEKLPDLVRDVKQLKRRLGLEDGGKGEAAA
jgi:UDP-3-O-[3-hydroxymyristoyl] glucosamine N-acyltransferase